MAAKMPGEHVTVTSLVSGRVETAVKLQCMTCGFDLFVALLIGKKQDLHLQCRQCGESHCVHDSECHKEGGD